jgi:hypothetical protein
MKKKNRLATSAKPLEIKKVEGLVDMTEESSIEVNGGTSAAHPVFGLIVNPNPTPAPSHKHHKKHHPIVFGLIVHP